MRDPQNAPDFYVTVVRRVTDADGVEMVVLRNQDGEEFVIDANEYPDYIGMVGASLTYEEDFPS